MRDLLLFFRFLLDNFIQLCYTEKNYISCGGGQNAYI